MFDKMMLQHINAWFGICQKIIKLFLLRNFYSVSDDTLRKSGIIWDKLGVSIAKLGLSTDKLGLATDKVGLSA